MAIAYPKLNVKIAGFMPGLSSPGGPSHQAIEDIALMRALPNMTVLDLADATEITQAVAIAVDHAGPVYLRLKRGEIPRIFDENHRLKLGRAHVLQQGKDVALVASGMMVPSALAAARVLAEHGISVAIVNSPVIKPLDAGTILSTARGCRLVVTIENHSIIGGLGSAVAEVMAEAGVGTPLRRIGIKDVFAESGSREFLFQKYGLDVSRVVEVVWSSLGRREPMPQIPVLPSSPGTYAPV
jgi:transketolase